MENLPESGEGAANQERRWQSEHAGPLAASVRIFTVAPEPKSLTHPVPSQINGLRRFCVRAGHKARPWPGLPGGRHLTTTSVVMVCRVLIAVGLLWTRMPHPVRKSAAHDNDMVVVSWRSLPMRKASFRPIRKNPHGCCQWAMTCAELWSKLLNRSNQYRSKETRHQTSVVRALTTPLSRTGLPYWHPRAREPAG